MKFGKFIAIVSSSILSFPFSFLSPFGLPLCMCWYSWWMIWGFAHFSLFLWHYVHQIVYFQMTYFQAHWFCSSASSSLLLRLFSFFFHFNYCTFQLQDFYFVLFLVISLSLLIVSILWEIILILSNSLHTSSFHTLDTFIITDLKCLSNKSNICIPFSGTLFIVFLSLCMGHTSLFVYLYVENNLK